MARRTVNLDEFRVAATEANGGGPEVILGGTSYELPAELPLAVVIAIRDGDWSLVARVLFGEWASQALEAGLSTEDLNRIARGAYGLGSGESAASPG